MTILVLAILISQLLDIYSPSLICTVRQTYKAKTS